MDLFSNLEQALTEIEKQQKIPQLINVFMHTSESNKITGKQICRYFTDGGFPLSQQRLCAWIAYIRTRNLAQPFVIVGTRKGYFLTNNPNHIEMQISSFEGRIVAMRGIVDALRAQKKDLIK